VGSDQWAKMPRGYRLRHFAEILGFRARLPDLEGGGWVSWCQGMPGLEDQRDFLWKQETNETT